MLPPLGCNNENFTLAAVRSSPHQSLSYVLSGRKPPCGNGCEALCKGRWVGVSRLGGIVQ